MNNINRRFLLLLNLLLAGLMMTGCGNAATQTAAPPTSSPTLPPEPTPIDENISHKITYTLCGLTSDNGINFDSCEIYVMNADGSNPTQLTNNKVWDCCSSWSPDGTKIAFLSDSEIYVMNADGSNQIQLTTYKPHDAEPRWSPDGKKIVFTSDRDDNNNTYGDIYVMNADGSNQTSLTENGSSGEPVWSPDGSKIAFVHLPIDLVDDYEILVMNADGSNPIQLTDNDRGDLQPAWSPDGTKIAFVAYELTNVNQIYEANAEIYVMNADGSNPIRLTNSTASDRSPTWSPDGKKIVFESDRDGRGDIYVMNADGSAQTRLTYTTGTGTSAGLPAWSH